MIRFDGVTVRFERSGRPGETVTAVDDLTLEVAAGETLCLIGPSGCGKTTTLRLVNRMVEASNGSVHVDGRDVREVDPVRLRRGIGYVIQSGGLFPHLSVRRNVGLLCELEGWTPKRTSGRVDDLLRTVDLDPDEFGGRFPAELSGGQAQRVGIARALALDPPVMLLDEPFGALDPITRRQVQDEFLALRGELQRTMLIVSHDLDEAFRLGDRIALLADGRLAQVGSPEELEQNPSDDFVREFVARHAHG